ncbi:ferric reductase transmembrane component 3 [Histoplasma capsulatum var. duboisii H88]|uniref:Ferric reductase transmembrane component 3 n=1 Tax=Ajellomyces capsulatus (strain H88) TaxID=544711 RepID=A0A8A1LB35_AJEC8|nr:ferric reductase transmembrane component 3 [Histoplasma capsulatum var. duboisii H88]
MVYLDLHSLGLRGTRAETQLRNLCIGASSNLCRLPCSCVVSCAGRGEGMGVDTYWAPRFWSTRQT